MDRSRWLTSSSLVIVVGSLVACGSKTSAAQFARSVIRWSAAGEYGRVYDNLYPAQRRVISREKYIECARSLHSVANRFGLDLTTLRPVDITYVTTQTTSVPGTRNSTHATVVQIRVSVVIRGKRRVLSRSMSLYVTWFDGHWRYIDGRGTPLVAHCVAPAETLGSELLAKVPAWAKKERFTNNPAAIAGAKLFAVSGCLNCHRYLGLGGGFRGAPDLTAEGSMEKGIEFQIAHLRCPSCVSPSSPMPSFARLGAANLKELATFLEASRG